MPRPLNDSRHVFIALALAVVFVGCGPPPARVPTVTYEPTVVGVIQSVTPTGEYALEFQLASGGSYAVDGRTSLGGDVPAAQDLLLAGTYKGKHWAHVVAHDAAGGSCYRMQAPAFLRDGRVLFPSGLSLPTSPGFNASSADPDGVWSSNLSWFCINTEGFVAGYEAFDFQ